ncbi:phage baseplate protein [Desertibacillus haloalkaliphilus]|uniref:phage baseplate protein n=1 Tax=Desertibacillus haloalkaliphilus TaxID=1328930 RepID=UPI001C256946|nr:hypothetical protein [Desertibacillus haloalkaliphilus]MBU8908500.1 hypothetical protein [Desertibacillus haloalkaliphilus]
MASINGIPISVIDEDRNYDNESTDHPVEEDQDITDHVINNPITFRITGEVTGDNAAQIDAQLRELRRGELVRYVGRAILPNAVFDSYRTTVDSRIANGFRFTLTLKQVKLARPSTVSLLSPEIRSQVKDVGNAGRVQVQ